jgi:peroxiredoxin
LHVTALDVVLAAALLLSWTIVGFQSWLLYLLIKQHGRMLIASDEQHGVAPAIAPAPAPASAQAQPQGLALGSPAPDFALRDLKGHQRKLRDYSGKAAMLVFFNPECGFCSQIAPKLAEMASSDRRLVLMSRGDRKVHMRMAEQHGWRFDVLIEDGWQVATSYGTNATPTGYLIDARGRIASSLAVGEPGIAELAKVQLSGGKGHGGPDLTAESLRASEALVAEKARAAGLGIRETTINRNGLPAGTVAPNFTLPDLAGGERTLADYRGRRVLLVFSDPACGPCQALGPELERLHLKHADNNLEVLVISRGDRSANMSKVGEHGLTFPVLLQSGWETSRDYAMFATPIGYLIDERGVIASQVAVGKDAVMGLVTAAL